MNGWMGIKKNNIVEIPATVCVMYYYNVYFVVHRSYGRRNVYYPDGDEYYVFYVM